MRIVEAFLERHPVLAYFGLTFILSWGGVLLVIGGPAGMTGGKAQDNPLFPLAVLAMLAGPSVTGILLTGLIDGKRGLRACQSRLLKWRVGGRWYAIALLAAPLTATATTLSLSFVSPEFLPGLIVADDKMALLLLGLAVGVAAGFFEELGWTGFAIPQLRRHYGVMGTGLIVGLLWSGWHLLVVIWGMGNRAGTVPLGVFVIVDGLAGLPVFRVLMVWVYDRTESLLLSMLMHVSLTATVLILTPQTTGIRLLTYGLAFAAAVWLAVAFATSSRRRPARVMSNTTEPQERNSDVAICGTHR
jgi:membrane protease YdiL (CAAX protease family)